MIYINLFEGRDKLIFTVQKREKERRGYYVGNYLHFDFIHFQFLSLTPYIGDQSYLNLGPNMDRLYNSAYNIEKEMYLLKVLT